MNFVEVVSSFIDSARRFIKFRRKGIKDVQSSYAITPFGVDASPIPGITAVYGTTGINGKTVILGYINTNQLAEAGEYRIFSVDASGALQTYQWLKADGTQEIGGNTDFMVRFSKLKESVDELKNDLNTLKTAVSGWVPVGGDGGAALKTALASWYAAQIVKNIDDAKISEIKTI